MRQGRERRRASSTPTRSGCRLCRGSRTSVRSLATEEQKKEGRTHRAAALAPVLLVQLDPHGLLAAPVALSLDLLPARPPPPSKSTTSSRPRRAKVRSGAAGEGGALVVLLEANRVGSCSAASATNESPSSSKASAASWWPPGLDVSSRSCTSPPPRRAHPAKVPPGAGSDIERIAYGRARAVHASCGCSKAESSENGVGEVGAAGSKRRGARVGRRGGGAGAASAGEGAREGIAACRDSGAGRAGRGEVVTGPSGGVGGGGR